MKSCWIQLRMYGIYSHKGIESPVLKLTKGCQIIFYFCCVPTNKNQATGRTLYQGCNSTLFFHKHIFPQFTFNGLYNQVQLLDIDIRSCLPLFHHYLCHHIFSPPCFLLFIWQKSRRGKRIAWLLALGLWFSYLFLKTTTLHKEKQTNIFSELPVLVPQVCIVQVYCKIMQKTALTWGVKLTHVGFIKYAFHLHKANQNFQGLLPAG